MAVEAVAGEAFIADTFVRATGVVARGVCVTVMSRSFAFVIVYTRALRKQLLIRKVSRS